MHDAMPTTKPWIPAASPAVHPEAIGLWRVPVGERERFSPGVMSLPGIVRFLYDGQTVTLSLMTEKEWMWKSPDDHYRLEMEWKGDMLFYRPPFGGMTPLARFVGDHFESGDGKPPWRFESVPSRDACDAQDLVLLAERKVHDYSIKPTD
jgi:hypothetical protein